MPDQAILPDQFCSYSLNTAQFHCGIQAFSPGCHCRLYFSRNKTGKDSGFSPIEEKKIPRLWHYFCSLPVLTRDKTNMSQEVRRQWYVVYSKPNREEYAQYHLQRKGIDVFFPRLRLPVTSTRQRQVMPLFPSYLFVQLQIPNELSAVVWCPGVKCLVSFNGTPAPLDDRVVDFLRCRATEEGMISAHPNLMVGQEVCITDGPLEGLKGIIQHPPDARGRVRVLMTLLNRALTVTVPITHVQTDWVVTQSEHAVPVSL